MLRGDTLSDLLYALGTGYLDRAKNIVYTTDDLDDRERELLRPILEDAETRTADKVIAIGDALRQKGAGRALYNECYRLAFYLSEEPDQLSENPLYAYFLAHRSGRLLDKWVHYFPIYHRHLERFKGTDARVLEIGVFHGGSLDMWKRYFGPSVRLVGIDIDEASARLADSSHTVVIGDQADRAFLTELLETYGPFDVVIDDGGHAMDQQIVSAETLFPGLKPGGTYIVEDAHTSYWAEFGGGERLPNTFIEWVKRRIDDLHRYHLEGPVDPIWTSQVGGIHCYDSVVVLEKQVKAPPFNEQAGATDFVYESRPVEIRVAEMLATRDAAITQFRELEVELAGADKRRETAEAARERAQSELTATRNDLLESWEQIRAMRRSISWRMTWPIRALQRLSRRT